MERLSFLLLCVSILNFLRITEAGDSVTPALNLIDGQTVVSDGGRFELGFFSPGQSRNRYLGIWYKEVSNDRGIIWVANSESPLNNNNGVLKMSTEGKLVLLNETGNNVVWFINSSKKTDNSVVIVAQLLNTGNLVVKEENDNNPNNYLWQSFDHPGAVLLPGMKLGFNFKTGANWYLSSWKTTEDASSGDFKLGIDPHGVPQIVLWQRENVALRIGHWNGIRFPGFPYMNPNSMFGYDFISNEDEVYFSLEFDRKSSVGNMMLLNQSGVFGFLGWNDHIHNWFPYSVAPLDLCASYNSCGAYGSCNVDNSDAACQCLNGFVPSVPEDWNSMNWTSGCVRRTPLDCMNGEGFRKFTGIKFPDTRNSVVIQKMRFAECEEVCLKNCSCTAYAMADIKERNGCLLWFGDLIDMRTFPGNGDDIYVKMAASELDVTKGGFKEKRRVTLLVTCLLLLLGVLLAVMTYLWKRKRQKNRENTEVESMEELELPMLDFDVITAATEYFSLRNKVGEGGFGPVYKGKLHDGQEIAIKRLSKNSTQGLEEFKNEVKLVSKLQHRDLVKLLGCCIQGEEKMLIYEYMPNKSLDSFIFDKTKSFMLDWATRYKIIHGIARGLVYLHQDSRLRIVHRDLKSSNILLDMEMNPKISDFGLARPFGEDQSEANTNKVVGTYGYMSPEYAIDGRFSFKSDVFSFGVIVLEIVSGKKNRGFYHPDHYHNLLGHAWKLWQESEAVLLVDARIRNTFNLLEVLRCIHVGLLCVQQCPDDRPSMSQVISMLGNEVPNLPQPELPGFFTERILQEANSTSKGQESISPNELSITMLKGR